ncbi:MAG: hypothetical protein FJ100_02675 [Deltaproteobacteria bacterium]|nr:hypothetical protein [Deltaproteobacteria bacterium]
MRRLFHSILCLAALAAVVAGPSARAAPLAVVGARPIDRGDWSGWAAAGLPDFEFGAMFGLASTADAGGRLRLGYGNGQALGGFGAAAAGVLRTQFASAGPWAFALVSEPGLFVHGGISTWSPYAKVGKKGAVSLFGVDAGLPSLAASALLMPNLNLSLSIGAPARVYLAPEPTLELPVLFKVAVQYGLSGPWSLLAGADLGATFYGPGGGAPAGAVESRVRFGVGYCP